MIYYYTCRINRRAQQITISRCPSGEERPDTINLHIPQSLHIQTDTFISYHRPRVKTSTINSLKTRALGVCDQDHKETEISRLREVFEANTYPKYTVRSTLKKKSLSINIIFSVTAEEDPWVETFCLSELFIMF